MSAINIVLNGEGRTVESGTDLLSLMKLFSLPEQRIAVELNEQVVRKPLWAETTVCEGDRVEVVQFVGGG